MNRYTLGTAVLTAWLVLPGAATELAQAQETSEYARSMAQWRVEREEALKGPDGWLNLAGLYWLDPGVTSFGSAPDNDIVLADLPAPPRLGEFLLEEGDIRFRAEPGAGVFSNGEPVTELRLVHDEAGEPTILTHGTLSWHAIGRMERIGVRLRDLSHPELTAFPGIKSYPADPSWRVEARFEAYEEPQERILSTVVEGLGWNPMAPGNTEVRNSRRAFVAGSLRCGTGVPPDFRRSHNGEENLSCGPIPVCVRARPRWNHDRGLQQGPEPALRLHRLRHLPATHPAESPARSHRSRRTVRQAELSSSGLVPVFYLQAGNAAKFSQVVCYQSCTQCSGMCCDQQVVLADGLPVALQFGSNRSVVAICGWLQW